ncbi:hypothetical protein I0C86_23865 [Plantactinospora sp. S1510]|uniref:Uncharacterized protein n=1 Tax=Plantactinospora alkalitolerans TaxID=2789879 RepID=A0ABS0H191_9ACTN|nr:hypothetical protein [Plantactinospora alkalitolerans]MBF9131978.1 hypothetical protein [Plantactinospora alkalitolerans]
MNRRPSWRKLSRQQRYRLPIDQVPRADVELDPLAVDRFGRFIAMVQERAPGHVCPIYIDVLLRPAGPEAVTAWTPPSERIRGTLVGRLTGPAVPAYAAVLAGLARDQAPMASFTAHQLAPGRYTAFVEGWPPD